jgi:alpha-1,2-mannosyltransferase
MVLALLWGVAALAWHRGYRRAAAVCLAITCVFKPQLALFLLWGAMRRQWRFVAVFAAVFVVIESASIAAFGWQNNLQYLSVLQYLSHHGEAYWTNQSMNGVLERLLQNGEVHLGPAHFYPPYRRSIYITTLIFQIAAVAIALMLPPIKRWAGTTADLLFFGAVAAITAPLVWEHHYSYFFFLILYLLAQAEKLSRKVWLLFAACVLAMSNRLPPLDALAATRFNIASSYLFYSGITILVLVALQATQRARAEA